MTTSSAPSQIALPPHRRVPKQALRFVAVAALLVLGGGLWDRHINADPQVAIPPPAALPVPNAYDDLVRIAATNVEPSLDLWQPTSKVTVGTTSQTVVHTNTDADRRAALAKAEPALVALHAALTAHAFREPARRGSFDVDPAYSRFRSLDRSLAFAAKMCERDGDYKGAVDAGLDSMQFGALIPQGGGLIPRMVGAVGDSLGRKPLWQAVDHLNAQDAASAAQRLELIAASREPLADSLTEEKWIGASQMREMLGKGATVSVYRHIIGSPGMAPDEDEATSIEPPTRGEQTRKMFRNWFLLMTHSKQSMLDEQMRDMDLWIAQSLLPFDPRRDTLAHPSNPLTRVFLPSRLSYRETFLRDAESRINDGLLILAFALRAYQLQNGSYPDTLDRLVQTGLLHDVPADPFAGKTGLPLHYRRIDANHFRLYSVGPDGIDDGGQPVNAHYDNGQPRNRMESTDRGDWVYGINTPKPAVQP